MPATTWKVRTRMAAQHTNTQPGSRPKTKLITSKARRDIPGTYFYTTQISFITGLPKPLVQASTTHTNSKRIIMRADPRPLISLIPGWHGALHRAATTVPYGLSHQV